MIANKGIFVFAQIDRENRLLPVSLELTNAARELSKKLKNEDVVAVLISNKDIELHVHMLANAGADKVIHILSPFNSNNEYLAKAFYEVINDKKPSIVLIGATTTGRDIAPKISSALNTGLTADCTHLDINEKGMLAATRPTFGGELMATILCKTYPQMATVRPKVLPLSDKIYKENCDIEKFSVNFNDMPANIEIIEFIKKFQPTGCKIEDAQIIIAGGKGMKNKDGFKLIEEFAKKTGAAVGASRAAVDMGLTEHSNQIGQTGKVVTPKLYIACGISGAIQHIAGMSSANYIIAINKDSRAPIFNRCDLGIIGDVFKILPNLISKF